MWCPERDKERDKDQLSSFKHFQDVRAHIAPLRHKGNTSAHARSCARKSTCVTRTAGVIAKSPGVRSAMSCAKQLKMRLVFRPFLGDAIVVSVEIQVHKAATR